MIDCLRNKCSNKVSILTEKYAEGCNNIIIGIIIIVICILITITTYREPKLIYFIGVIIYIILYGYGLFSGYKIILHYRDNKVLKPKKEKYESLLLLIDNTVSKK